MNLEEFGRFNFKLNKPDQSGVTQRDHLEQVERQTGRRPEALDGPDFPELMAHVWSAFISLSKTRTVGYSGPNPISYEQIKAWKELTETPISAWEIEAVNRLDAVYLGEINNG